MKKLTLDELKARFLYGERSFHPARKDFILAPKKERGVLHPNPPGCRGLRRQRGL